MLQSAPLLLVLASALIAVIAYLQALDYPFYYDDATYITENARLAGLHLTQLWRLFTEPYNDFSEFLPLRDISYWLDLKLSGLNPSGFRVHNIVLYLLCLPLVYGTTSVLWRYFHTADAPAAPWAAAAVTALFALHPAQVESVVWIAGRKDVLSTLFSLLALWLAARTRLENGFSSLHAASALVTLLAAMLSKATAVAVAPVIALLWLVFWRDIPASNRRRPLLLWPVAILVLAVCFALIFATAIKSRIPFYPGVETATRALAVLGWLTRLAVSPESRHFLYPVLEDQHLPAMVALGVAVPAAAIAGWIMLLRRRSLEGFALVAFFLLCTPYLQLVPYVPPSLVADHFLALAVWPVMLLAVALSWRLQPMPRTVLLLAFALPWSFQTMERPRDLRSKESLIEADFRAYPGHYMPAVFKIIDVQLPRGLYREASVTANSIAAPEIRNIMLGLIDANHAEADATVTGRPQEAIALFWKLGFALKQPPAQAQWNPPMRFAWENFISALTDEWEHLAGHFPDNGAVRYNAGLWMLEIRNNEGAVTHLRAATEAQNLPESARGAAFMNLGLALLNSGHVAEAEAALRAALEQSPPDLRASCRLSEVYKQTNQPEKAMRAEAGCRSSERGESAIR